MGEGSGKNVAGGCITLIVLIFFGIFVLPILLEVFRVFGEIGLPFAGIVPTLVWIGFLIAFLRVIAKIIKAVGAHKQPDSQRTNVPSDIPSETYPTFSERPSEPAEREFGVPKDQPAYGSSEQRAPSGEVLSAFAKLGCNPGMTYTQVSERYYQHVKKLNAAKMDEEKRQAKLRELEEAFEIVTRYYSEIT